MTISWPESTNLKRPQKRAKSSKPRKSPERAIQVAVVRALKRYCKPEQAKWFAVPNGGYRHLYTAMKLQAEGTQRGTPDLCFTLAGGRSAYLELKAEKGRLSEEQIKFRDDIAILGGLWAVAHSVDEAWGILAGWGCLPSAVSQEVLK